MTRLAPTMQAFFTTYLVGQKGASPATVTAYRNSLRLLLTFAQQQTGITPSRLDVADLNAPLIGDFLDHLETQRHNSVRTRNARLAAIHSLFRYAATRLPEHADDIARVLAIPAKRFTSTVIDWLTEPEIQALLTACDRATWTGRRDYALLHLACQTGLRASELTALTLTDLHLGDGAHVACHGKRRKTRITPLTKTTVAVLRAWLAERGGTNEADIVFPTRKGTQLSRDALERRISLYAQRAAGACPSLTGKKLSPHVLRHTAAMRLLHAGVEETVIALWLGHESTQTTRIYLAADMELKQKALDRTTPVDGQPGRYLPSDQLLAFLDNL